MRLGAALAHRRAGAYVACMRLVPRWVAAVVAGATVALVPTQAASADPIWSLLPAGPAGAAQPRVAADGNGTSTVVWQQAAAGGTELWGARQSGTSGLAGTVRISEASTTQAPAAADEPALAATPTGAAVLAWTARLSASRFTVVYASVRAQAGGSWSTPKLLSDPAYAASAPTATIDSNGQAVIAWQQASVDYTQIRVASLDPSTTGVTPLQTISSTSGYLTQPRIAASAQGSAYLSWLETAVAFSPPYTGANTLRAATRAPGAATFGTGSQVTKSTTAEFTDVQLAVDAAGNASLAWAQPDATTGAPGGAWVATRLAAATTWPGVRLSTASGTSPALATSQAGGAVLAWVEPGTTPGTGTVRAALRKVGLTTWNSATTLSGASEAASRPAAAMSANGNAVLTWQAGTPGGDVARQAVWPVGATAPWPAADVAAADGTLASPQLAASDAAALAIWLRTPATGAAIPVLARLDGSSAGGTPPAPTPTPAPSPSPAPTASPTPTPTAAPSPTAAPTASPSPTKAPTPTPTPTKLPTPATTPTTGSTTTTTTTTTTADLPQTDLAAAPTLVAFRALAPKRFAPGTCADPLVATGKGLPLEIVASQAGTVRIVVASTPRGKRARNLRPAISADVVRGTTRTVFTGCLAGKALRRGRYALKLVYSDAGGMVRGRKALPIVIGR